MATKEEVRAFLSEFFEKMNVWDVLFREDRGKNFQTLTDLNLRPFERKEILWKLKVEDYVEGPLEDRLYGGAAMWVFGKKVKSEGIYIKVSLGMVGTSVVCISFHIAEYPLKFPFKNG